MSLCSGAVSIKFYSILLYIHTQTPVLVLHSALLFWTPPCFVLKRARRINHVGRSLACTCGAVLCCVIVKGEASITQSHNHQSRRNAKSQSVAVAAETLHVTWKSNRGLRAMTPCGGGDNSPAALWGELMTASAPGLLLRMGVIKVDRRLPALMAM